MSNVENFFQVETARKAAGISVRYLLATATVKRETWNRFRAGGPTRPATVRRLVDAINHIASTGERPPPLSDGEMVAMRLRDRLIMVAIAAGADPDVVLAQDFSVQKPLNPVWLEASQLRRLAIYLLIVESNETRADVAAAAGCTRQNIHQALRWVEERRDSEPAFAALVERLSGWLSSGGAA